MAQQDMDFERNADNSARSYTSGYEESPNYNEYSYRTAGQKIPPQESAAFTNVQRFALAILSLCLFTVLCILFVVLAFVMPVETAKIFAPVFASMGFFFMILLVFLNIIVNRKR